MQQSKDTERRH